MTTDPESPIDKKHAMQIFDNDEELFLDIAGVFLSELPGHEEALRAALDAGDSEAVRKRGHMVKGAAGSIAANGVRDIARGVEAAGKAQDLEQARSLFEQLLQEFRRVEGYLREMIPDDD